ncbi:hypothetical protein [Enterovibrio baiacu]|uniref:hypothetical protein n=1 Tax=Enterovibrio baiacu TaxID=2491023 RepID=UPI001011C262|nr:hypothetical protein [Enterovibrio baiacu]MBE1275501.1 hypothetical protein [Enterovibrio baiacu]
MIIECPHCATNNSIDFAEHITCCECKKSFKGQSFRKLKKPLLSAGTAVVLGIIGGIKTEQFLDENRYPIHVEYAIVDTCLNSSNRTLHISQYKDKRSVCLCAIESTIANVSYRDFKESQKLFNEPFKAAIAECKRGS